MARAAPVPANDRAPARDRAPLRKVRARKLKYHAFLSYSHKDEALADWLHRELEAFRVPASLVGRLAENGPIPKKLTPIFRDQHELAAADDLGEEIEAALASTQFLIVLCSPNAAASRWTNAEIAAFKKSRPDGCIFAVIADGEPFASDIPGRESEECFPPALRQKYDRRGRPTGRRAEPLAADLRGSVEERRVGFLKLVAGMLGVGLDDLVQRETTQRHRRLAWLAAASLAGMAVTSGLAITAIQARDAARDQRREAEGLVAFMLGDLRDKLEPIGKLDALDGVGTKVLAYYSKQDASALSDAGLIQRSRALGLTAQVAYLRGNYRQSAQLYEQARAGTAEAVARRPRDAKALYEHAQNVFWTGELSRQLGRIQSAENDAREYRRLAQRMVALEPENMRWRAEEQNAAATLGTILYSQRQFGQASAEFANALRIVEGLAAANPTDRDYQVSLAECIAWAADSRMSQGQLQTALSMRTRNVALLNALVRQSGGDVAYRTMLVPALRALGNLQIMTGQVAVGLGTLDAAVQTGAALVSADPSNGHAVNYLSTAQLNLADQLLTSKRTTDAQALITQACREIEARPSVASAASDWRAGLRFCKTSQSRLALQTGQPAAAADYAQTALRLAMSVKSSDPIADRFAGAKAWRLLGDARAAQGRIADAQGAWHSALALVPKNVPERPTEMIERAAILMRLEAQPDARLLAERLQQIGATIPMTNI